MGQEGFIRMIRDGLWGRMGDVAVNRDEVTHPFASATATVLIASDCSVGDWKRRLAARKRLGKGA